MSVFGVCRGLRSGKEKIDCQYDDSWGSTRTTRLRIGKVPETRACGITRPLHSRTHEEVQRSLRLNAPSVLHGHQVGKLELRICKSTLRRTNPFASLPPWGSYRMEWVFGGPLTLNPSFSLHQKDVPLPDTVAPGGLPTNKAKEKAGTSRQTVRVFQWCRHNSHDEGMVRAWSGELTF